jgi:hypothetical protein
MKPTRLKSTDKELTPEDMEQHWLDLVFWILDGDIQRSQERKEMFNRFIRTFQKGV